MATTTPQDQPQPRPQSHAVRDSVAAGTSIGAAMLLAVIGALSILQGISAVAADDLFVSGPEYVYQIDLTAWGWVHIVLGILLVVSAVGLWTGSTWGRVVAIAIASLSIIANFLWLPYYPAWSIVVIALGIVVIWAVATWRPETS